MSTISQTYSYQLLLLVMVLAYIPLSMEVQRSVVPGSCFSNILMFANSILSSFLDKIQDLLNLSYNMKYISNNQCNMVRITALIKLSFWAAASVTRINTKIVIKVVNNIPNNRLKFICAIGIRLTSYIHEMLLQRLCLLVSLIAFTALYLYHHKNLNI